MTQFELTMNVLATAAIVLPWLCFVRTMWGLPFGSLSAWLFGTPSGLFVAFIIWRIWA